MEIDTHEEAVKALGELSKFLNKIQPKIEKVDNSILELLKGVLAIVEKKEIDGYDLHNLAFKIIKFHKDYIAIEKAIDEKSGIIEKRKIAYSYAQKMNESEEYSHLNISFLKYNYNNLYSKIHNTISGNKLKSFEIINYFLTKTMKKKKYELIVYQSLQDLISFMRLEIGNKNLLCTDESYNTILISLVDVESKLHKYCLGKRIKIGMIASVLIISLILTSYAGYYGIEKIIQHFSSDNKNDVRAEKETTGSMLKKDDIPHVHDLDEKLSDIIEIRDKKEDGEKLNHILTMEPLNIREKSVSEYQYLLDVPNTFKCHFPVHFKSKVKYLENHTFQDEVLYHWKVFDDKGRLMTENNEKLFSYVFKTKGLYKYKLFIKHNQKNVILDGDIKILPSVIAIGIIPDSVQAFQPFLMDGSNSRGINRIVGSEDMTYNWQVYEDEKLIFESDRKVVNYMFSKLGVFDVKFKVSMNGYSDVYSKIVNVREVKVIKSDDNVLVNRKIFLEPNTLLLGNSNTEKKLYWNVAGSSYEGNKVQFIFDAPGYYDIELEIREMGDSERFQQQLYVGDSKMNFNNNFSLRIIDGGYQIICNEVDDDLFPVWLDGEKLTASEFIYVSEADYLRQKYALEYFYANRFFMKNYKRGLRRNESLAKIKEVAEIVKNNPLLYFDKDHHAKLMKNFNRNDYCNIICLLYEKKSCRLVKIVLGSYSSKNIKKFGEYKYKYTDSFRK